MVNPSHVLAAMVPFDNNEKPITACAIWILRSDPFWIQGGWFLVALISDAKPPLHRFNGGNDSLPIECSPIDDNLKSCIEKSWVQQVVLDRNLILGNRTMAGTCKGALGVVANIEVVFKITYGSPGRRIPGGRGGKGLFRHGGGIARGGISKIRWRSWDGSAEQRSRGTVAWYEEFAC